MAAWAQLSGRWGWDRVPETGPLLSLPKPLSTESLPPLALEHPLGNPDPFSPQLSFSSKRTLGYGTLWSVS